MFNLHTMAEQLIHMLASLPAGANIDPKQYRGELIIQMTGPEIVYTAPDGDDTGAEDGPDGESTTECDYLMYQFPDRSIIWHVRSPKCDYLQLRGIYGMEFRHSQYIAAGQPVCMIEQPKPQHDPILDKGVEHLDINVRTQNCLIHAGGIHYIGQLLPLTKNDLLKIPNLGRKSVDQLIEQMAAQGLQLGTDVGNWKVPQHR